MTGPRLLARLWLVPAVIALTADGIAAQPLGTFRWHLQPYCNVVTLDVVQKGALFALDGIDNRCGAGPVSVVGVAFLNLDGTVGMGLTLVVIPAAPVHITAELSTATLNGAWTDSAGNGGPLVFNPATPAPGAPRPAAGLGARPNGNTAVGAGALLVNADGANNTAIGLAALQNNATGLGNVAVGRNAMRGNLTASDNVAVGHGALPNLHTGTRNIAIGLNAGNNLNSGSGNVYIANPGSSADDNTIRIGTPVHTRVWFYGIRPVVTGNNNAIPVLIDSTGQLGTIASTRRAKEDIAALGGVSHQIFNLRPVQFRYRQAFTDGSKPLQYGLIAEEVANVLPELVAEDEDGQPASVKYHVLPTLLLAEVQRLERERAAQAVKVDDLENHVAAQQTALESLRAELTAALARVPASAAKKQ